MEYVSPLAPEQTVAGPLMVPGCAGEETALIMEAVFPELKSLWQQDPPGYVPDASRVTVTTDVMGAVPVKPVTVNVPVPAVEMVIVAVSPVWVGLVVL